MKYILILTSLFILSGCNTIKGFGNDIQDAGMAIQYGISDIQSNY